MKIVSPFPDANFSEHVAVSFDGQTHFLPKGTNLAAALLSAGITVFRNTPVSGAARAPYCMMGACFECLVEIDGVVRQACMMEVSEGLDIQHPQGRNSDDADL
ncbi:(2Fe-2S)-binding protein [Roseibium sediminis]|uniref:(2Fe-2S)-binding protein n=1 Tax=Roseibium sediminis TaxID=1775174 RepID=UPI001FCB4610|nr:(2Fe-2S)-binding protein [Roseibium sediminis]